MKLLRKALPALLLGLVCALSSPRLDAQSFLNAPLPKVELEGYTATKAARFEDYQGRAVLIEFFAYW
jgi:hypothetical protein